eukprot:TRINITY_DN13531_c0_g1_i1.p1 TRINITY_DN13531_c0_g1~~TRINITY_DN13531_c0_g1_i1.p1  ORF type:complete len:742 (-),score=254.79 TRINITY_DN13531_c0_g1_i1:262-2487(-)
MNKSVFSSITRLFLPNITFNFCLLSLPTTTSIGIVRLSHPPYQKIKQKLTMELTFHLDDSFIQQYAEKKPDFGFSGLGDIVFKRTYARTKDNGEKEEWFETVRRVVEGTYSIQQNHIEKYSLGWNDEQGQKSAQEMYKLIFEMKFLPPGRGLWAMGTSITHKRGLAAALNNCAFVSTQDMENEPVKPFAFLMDASMLGVGVGFDCKGQDFVVLGSDESKETEVFVVPDSREGWVDSLRVCLKSMFGVKGVKQAPVKFDYSEIRPAGLPLKVFGGVSSGPAPLVEMHEKINMLLGCRIGQAITSRIIVDIFNLIGKCVVSGNTRRSAEIAFGEPDDESFLDLKNYEKNPDRMEWGWCSNNSVFAELGMDYTKICERIALNGEPGLAWLQNMREFGRMGDPKDYKDTRVAGGNPCLEQSLESFEMCCLVETFPARHASVEEYLRTLKFAYLYAKCVTLGKTHWPDTNRVLLRNRRIGCSLSGVAQFLAKNNIAMLQDWLRQGYDTIQRWDTIYSDWLCVPKSKKTTSVKPSGSVSLLAGSTPGMHFPESNYYIRRVRIAKDSELIAPLREAGYPLPDCHGLEETMVVVEVPVSVGDEVRCVKDVSMFEQLNICAFLQEHWADNQVSCTVSFDPETEAASLPFALDFFQYKLKGVSFLPRIEYGAFPQMPYEAIDKAEFERRSNLLKPIVWKKKEPENENEGAKTGVREEAMDQAIMFCDGDHCEMIRPAKKKKSKKAKKEEEN